MDDSNLEMTADALVRIADEYDSKAEQIRVFVAMLETSADDSIASLAVRVPGVVMAALSTSSILGAAELAIVKSNAVAGASA